MENSVAPEPHGGRELFKVLPRELFKVLPQFSQETLGGGFALFFVLRGLKEFLHCHLEDVETGAIPRVLGPALPHEVREGGGALRGYNGAQSLLHHPDRCLQGSGFRWRMIDAHRILVLHAVAAIILANYNAIVGNYNDDDDDGDTEDEDDDDAVTNIRKKYTNP
jgi:hypothetical protein